MKQTNEFYADYECIKLENDSLAIWVTHDVGPRIIGLQAAGGDNLLAVLPNVTHTTPSGQVYWFRGGHRLWHAPEDPERTYVPDDTAVPITPIPNGIQTTQDVEPDTGIQKQMAITLPDNSAQVIIDHTLTNCGLWPVKLAPWAITQFKPGGFAILPQPTDDTSLLPNRRLAIWPYARINSPHLVWGNRFIFVHATMQNESFKLGWANSSGWLAYRVNDTLFVKQAAYQAGYDYYDFGSSSECYCNDIILELETLGPRVILEPGASVTHREVWRVFPNVSLMAEETAVADLIAQLNI
ncbi:MAG: hypothetical protein H6667_16780 [Ardenticatenaceae bacterium]|nr:hypothetical protein [Ardenticatenaceae bacterium]MCB9443106.1 hypothetical protein [Ardenticatenaceae bacterium]